MVLPWWPMGGEQAVKADSNKSVFFWIKKIEPVSLPVQITIISQGRRHKTKRKKKGNVWRKEKNSFSVVHNTKRTNTKKI